MAHPYASRVLKSTADRLKRIGGTAEADDVTSARKAAVYGDLMGKTKGFGPETFDERDQARYDDYKRGGKV